MKLKKLLCCILSSLFISIPFIAGCSSSEGSSDSLFNTSAQFSQTELSSAQPMESSYITESSQPAVSYPQSTDTEITPALWRAEDTSGNYIYLMGSMHMGDDAINYLPDYVNNAFNECPYLAVEADIDSILQDTAKLQQLAVKLVYADGTTIKDHLSEDTYNGIVSLLQEKGMYQAQYEYCKPFLWQSILTSALPIQTTLDIQHGVDMIFLQRAKNDNKQIIEIEDIDFQIDMFNSFSDGLYDLILSQFLKPNYSQLASEYLSALYTMWKKGVIDESMILSGTFLDTTNDNYEYMQEYYNKLIKERNIDMTKTIKSYLSSGQKVFVLVGSFHYCGEDGIISMLQKDGYTVSRIV